jgi:hypothetical protein
MHPRSISEPREHLEYAIEVNVEAKNGESERAIKDKSRTRDVSVRADVLPVHRFLPSHTHV